MKLSELGEFGLIELLAKISGEVQGRQAVSWQQLLVGIGDDAAAWHPDASIELATTDSLVQDIHFTLDTITWKELGWKAMAISLSDIAAMGGIPRYALASISLPEYTDVEDVANLYRGMVEIGQRFGVAIVGGDTSSATLITINTTVLGSTSRQAKKILTRSSARAGDKIAVTGYLGGAAASLEMLTQKVKLNSQDNNSLRQAFLKPNPRVAEGQILVQQGVKTAIDISDGLISDLSHICQASKVGARIKVDLVPVHPAVKRNFEGKFLEMALSGGEDYELLFTANSEVIEQITKAVNCPITVIGDIIADTTSKIILVDRQGKPYKPDRTGWQHFTTKK